MSVRKARVMPETKITFVVQGNYGVRYGNRWEDLDTRDSYEGAADLIKTLRADEPPSYVTWKYRIDIREVNNN